MTGNPFALLKAAATGSVDAQRALAEMALRTIVERPDVDPSSVLRDGLCFARLAAAQGDDGDEGRVISMLALLASFEAEHDQAEVLGEGIARYALLAERGVEVPGLSLEAMVAGMPADAVGVAQIIQEKMRERVSV